jgi:DNA-binding SARP family transcriptional activator
MRVDFRLLGDVEVRVGERLVNVGHARQRCVLVALLVEANHPVAPDRLLDRVWADRPPQRARNALAGYLSRLRQALGDADAVQIVHRPGGYVLETDPMAVDLHRFHRLVAQARATDAPAEGAVLFDQALDLWRGEAFASLDTPWLDDVRDALDAERQAAALDRNDVALRAGRHAELLPELLAQAAARPLDERLAGQLMLALYRCGRQADALAVYHAVRRRLVDELGADPSRPLRQLHQQILIGEPALIPRQVPPRPPGRTAVPGVPRQLPAPPRSFTGRTRELAALDALLASADEQQRTVVITALSGAAGVGKTALALHWAHKIADRFPDGQLYLNLRGFDPGGAAVPPAEAIRSFLEAFDVHPQRIPTNVDAQVGLYRSLLAERRVLVVLDNGRDSEQLRPLLPTATGCLALVTSRNNLSGLIVADGAAPLSLDVLSADEAHTLLARRLGSERLAAEPEAVDEIEQVCGGLPLALAIVAARAAARPDLRLITLTEQLRNARHRLDAFDVGDATIDLRSVFSWSYRALAPEAARLFRLVGVHPGPDISTAAAASLTARPLQQVRATLAELARANLLVDESPDRFGLHDLLRAYARELVESLEPKEGRDAAMVRLLDYYVHAADTADRRLYPHRDTIELSTSLPGVAVEELPDADHALAWLTREAPAMRACVRLAANNGFDSHAWQLASAMVNFLNRRGHSPEWTAAQDLALQAATCRGDRLGQAVMHRGLQQAYTQLGRFDDADAHGCCARTMFIELGDRAGLAQTHLAFGAAATRRGRYTEGLEHFERARDLYQAAGHHAGQANALNNLGWVHALLGEHRQALDLCRRSLDLSVEIGNRYMQGMAWDSLGYAHHNLGHLEDALSSYQNSLEIVREQGDQYSEAETLVRLGDSHYAVGDSTAAGSAWRQALKLYQELGHRDVEQVRTKLAALDI